MKLLSYSITARSIEFVIEAENEAERQLLKLGEYQVLSINEDSEYDNKFALSGTVCH